jgi:hypothetical protein
MGTLVAGYASGNVGVWHVGSGARLAAARLHGAVVHLAQRAGKLHAATELGDYTTLDLSVLDVPYCELLRRVWSVVPVVWEGGKPVRRPPPSAHACVEGVTSPRALP